MSLLYHQKIDQDRSKDSPLPKELKTSLVYKAPAPLKIAPDALLFSPGLVKGDTAAGLERA